MIPSPWVAAVLALATFRAVRLLSWDDLPPIVAARCWATGAYEVRTGSSNALAGLTAEQPDVAVRYRRPNLAHLLACPYCIGFWVSMVAYVAWAAAPSWTLYVAAPFALSAAVGMTARWLDP